MPSLTTVRVHQVCNPDHGTCAYIVECPRTRVAAVIDPTPAHSEPIALRIRASGLSLRFALHTRPRREEAEDEGGRFVDLVQSLGLAPPPQHRSSAGSWSWPGVPHVEPRPDPSGGRMLLASGDRAFEILPQTGPTCGTLGGCCPPPADRVHRARIALGVFHIDVIPIRGGSDPWVAFRVRDRVFSGGSLLSGSHGMTDDGTPPALLALDPDLLVHPRRTPRRFCVSTVGQERAWEEALRASREELLQAATRS